jgi:hypothetical protein
MCQKLLSFDFWELYCSLEFAISEYQMVDVDILVASNDDWILLGVVEFLHRKLVTLTIDYSLAFDASIE